MDRDEERDREQLARWAEEDLPLYGVVGLRRIRGGMLSGIGTPVGGSARRLVLVPMSEQVCFVGEGEQWVGVTSHREQGRESLDRIRHGAAMNAWQRSPAGRDARRGWDPLGGPLVPDDLPVTATTIAVDGTTTPFEVCDFGEGLWVAVGQLPELIVTIEGRGVPVASIRLERLTDRRIPEPPAPAVGPLGQLALRELDQRALRLPVSRVRRWADYWALLLVEDEHVVRLARRLHLDDTEQAAIGTYWRDRTTAVLSPTLDRLEADRRHERDIMRQGGRRLGDGFWYQLWFNTLGPGARTWLGNRYASIRKHTFRLRWRP